LYRGWRGFQDQHAKIAQAWGVTTKQLENAERIGAALIGVVFILISLATKS